MDASRKRGWDEALEEAQAKAEATYWKTVQTSLTTPQTVEHDQSQLRDILRTLRLLVGTMHSLGLLIAERRIQEADFHFRGPQPGRNVLDALNILLKDLLGLDLNYPINNRVPIRLHAILDVIRTAAGCHDYLGIETCLITNDHLLTSSRSHSEFNTWRLNQAVSAEDDSPYEDVLICLDEVLRGPEADAPGDLHSYKSHVAKRNLFNPRYSKSAWSLPELVKKHWDPVIEARVAQLFSPNKSGHFEYWLLEYATRQWPEHFDTTQALSKSSFTRLMSVVSDPSLRPLHVAAALGLEGLCRRLILDQGEEFPAKSPLGTPLYCALVGPNALLARDDDPMQIVADIRLVSGQRDTISFLLECDNIMNMESMINDPAAFGMARDEPLSMLTLAFLVCLALKDSDLFRQFLASNLDLDARFMRLFHGKASIDKYWPSKMPPISPSFLREATSFIIDYAISECLDFHDDIPELLRGIDQVVNHFGLKDETRKAKLHRLTDDAYYSLVYRVVEDGNLFVLQRLVCDPRWQPNVYWASEVAEQDRLSYNTPPPKFHDVCSGAKGTTILHNAVQCNSEAMVEIILNSSDHVNIHARNELDQTPLMLSETPKIFQLLHDRGARTTDTDCHGQNIWHIAAANEDIALIDCLVKKDENQDQNLKALMDGGHTPIAQSIIYPLTQLSEADREAIGALHLLNVCKKDPDYLRTPAPLILLAAQWGSEQLMTSLIEFGVDTEAVDENGGSALHNLNVSATPRLVRILQDAIGESATVNLNGSDLYLTPAETIFVRPHEVPLRTLNTSFKSRTLDPVAYKMLLVPEVRTSRNSRGQGLWERFATFVLGRLTYDNVLDSTIGPSLITATDLLIKSGIMGRFEKERGVSGISVLINAWTSERKETPFPTRWSQEILQLMLRATHDLEEFKSSDCANYLLKLAIEHDKTELARELLDMGVSVHPSHHGNISILEGACREHFICSKDMFRTLVSYADVEKLNENNLSDGTGFLNLLLDTEGPKRNHKLATLLRRGCSPNPATGVRGDPAVVAYIKALQIKAAVILLDHGADASATDKLGMDASLAAAQIGSLRILEKIANCKQTMDWKRTCKVYHRITMAGGMDQTVILRNCTALHLAALGGHTAVLEHYTQKLELDVNAIALDDIWTPLHCAALGGQVSCIRSLIQCGADPAARDSKGRTPRSLAEEVEQSAAVLFLAYPNMSDDTLAGILKANDGVASGSTMLPKYDSDVDMDS